MTFIKSLILGLIAGVTACVPISSTGMTLLCGHVLGLPMDGRLFLAVLLGILCVMVSAFCGDIIRLFYSFGGILRDIIYNFRCAVHPRRKRADDYRRILTGNYRNFFVQLLLASLPAVIIGNLLSSAIHFAYGNFLTIGMGFFITAVILFVSSYMSVPEKGPKLMKPYESLILGIFQGLGFLPGISKIGVISSAGFLCGVSRMLAVKFSYLLGIISIILIMVPGRIHPVFEGISASSIPVCAAAFLGTVISGRLVIRAAQTKITKENNRIFAGLNIMFGMAALLVQVLAG